MLPTSLIPPKSDRVVARHKRTEDSVPEDWEHRRAEVLAAGVERGFEVLNPAPEPTDGVASKMECDQDEGEENVIITTDELEIAVENWDNTKTIKQLRDRCVELDLPSTGRKAELLERLKEHAAQ